MTQSAITWALDMPAPKKRHASKNRRAYIFGLEAEQIAAALLRLKGYRILSERFKTPYGEIDLIAKRGNAIIFVEVKGRSNLASAAWAITPHQQRRIIAAAEFWRSQQPFTEQEPDYRFDIILIAPGQHPQHIENAFFMFQ